METAFLQIHHCAYLALLYNLVDWENVQLHELLSCYIFLNASLNCCFLNQTAEVHNLTFLPSFFFWVLSHFSETKIKQPNGTKHKLAKAASLPGRNGNPTFAAVAAGYDKSPGTRTSLKFLIIPNISWLFCYFAGVYFTHFSHTYSRRWQWFTKGFSKQDRCFQQYRHFPHSCWQWWLWQVIFIFSRQIPGPLEKKTELLMAFWREWHNSFWLGFLKTIFKV